MNIRVETPAILSIPESFVPFIEQWRSTPEEERLQFSPKSLQVKSGKTWAAISLRRSRFAHRL